MSSFAVYTINYFGGYKMRYAATLWDVINYVNNHSDKCVFGNSSYIRISKGNEVVAYQKWVDGEDEFGPYSKPLKWVILNKKLINW